jgi:hypothetical protein
MEPPEEPERETLKHLLYRRPVNMEPSEEPERGETLPWPDSTFVPEWDDAKHFPGTRWSPFVEDNMEIIGRIPEMLQNSLQQTGYGEIYKPPNATPIDWPLGIQMVWPIRNFGLALIVSVGKETNNLVDIFPFFGSGSQLAMTLREVCVREGGLEAQITATWGFGEVTFFDTNYLINRAWYETGKNYEFILSGIAYNARPAADREIKMDPDVVKNVNRRMKELKEEGFEEFEECEFPGTFTLKGVAMLLPCLPKSEWDADDYYFRAPVKSVKEFEDWLGQDGWRVRATALRHDDEDVDLDIVITRRVWQDKAPPQVGQDIEGSLWLQGRLWRHLK